MRGKQQPLRTVRSGAPGGRRPQRRRRHPLVRALLIAAKLTAVLSLAVSIAAGLFFARLLHGPISLSFLIGPIERAIAEEGTGMRVEIADAAVHLAGGHLEFALSNVRVSDASGTPLAQAPSASVSLSQPALLSGRLAPESVDLISPRLLLVYGEDGTVSLAFSRPGDREEGEPAGATGPARAPAAAPSERTDRELGRIDLVKMLSEASGRARRREHAGAYLRELGFKSATLIIANGSRRSVWRIPELRVDLDHHRTHSSIAGRIKVDSLAGPWTVNFRSSEIAAANDLQLEASVQGLVPRALALSVPQLGVLEGVDAPVWGDVHLTITNSGEIESGKIAIDAAPGSLVVPGLGEHPLHIDGAHLVLAYSRAAARFELEPSALVWGDSRLQFTGAMVHAKQGGGWAWELKSAGGWLGVEPPQLQRLQIDDWSARGTYSPERARIELSAFVLKAGGAELNAAGEIADLAGATRLRVDGKIGAMSANVFKTLWPSAAAPRTRRWVVERLARGRIEGGTFHLAHGDDGRGPGKRADGGQSALTLEGSDLAFALQEGWPMLEAPRVLLRVDEQQLELSVPDAALALPDGRHLALKGTFAVDMTMPSPRVGRLAVKVQGPVPAALQLLDADTLASLQPYGLAATNVDGKLEAQLAVTLPLEDEVSVRDVKLEGKARISEGRVRQVMAGYDVTGASLAVDVTPAAVEVKGDLLVNGVPAKAYLQHVFDVPPEKQPPGRITATLDDADRTQLGLDINDLVAGEVGIEVSLGQDTQAENQVHVRADLLGAEVSLDSIAWSKPKGRPSVFEFDAAKGSGPYPLELHNVRMVGENVAIEGWMGIGADNKAKEFRFPNFSLNVVSSLSAQGKMRPDGVWDVTARGPTYDGRDLFRSFFDVGHTERDNKVRPGLDLHADIDTVVGFSDSALRNVRIVLQKRLNKLTSLEVHAVQEGGKAFTAVLRPEPGQPRRLRAESTDAGQIFKTIGFYPNAVGGVMNLEVNLDGQGAAERTGTLWARDFVILGDPIVTSMVQNSESSREASARRTVVREQFDFEILRAPFSVGHGQFVMHNAVINGPLVSASLRGKVDFRAQTLDVGGTYVPMSGLMRVPADLPVFGPLLTGPRGEGVFGMTFAIQGTMRDPQLVMNPLSLITPGIFRELFQMTPEDPHVLPRDGPPRHGEATRSSSTPPTSVSNAAPSLSVPLPEVGGGWSVTSETVGSGR